MRLLLLAALLLVLPVAAQTPELRLVYDCKGRTVTFIAYGAGSFVLRFEDVAVACAKGAV